MEIKFIHPADVENLIRLYAEKRIHGNALAVGVVLAAYAGQDGIAHPSRSRLKTDTGLSLTRISAATNELAKAGWMDTAKGNRNANVYIVNRVQYPTPFEPEQECVDPSYKRTSPITGPVLKADQTSPISGPLLIHYMKEDIKEEYTDVNVQKTHQTTDHAPSKQTAPKGKPKVVRTDSGFDVPDTIRAAWVSAYPDIDIDSELSKAHAWCLTNPKKAAAKKDWGRFLNSWLGRARPAHAPSGGDISQEEADMYNAKMLEIENELVNETEAESCQAL